MAGKNGDRFLFVEQSNLAFATFSLASAGSINISAGLTDRIDQKCSVGNGDRLIIWIKFDIRHEIPPVLHRQYCAGFEYIRNNRRDSHKADADILY